MTVTGRCYHRHDPLDSAHESTGGEIIMSNECKANRGNPLQHWTLGESMTALRRVTLVSNPHLLFLDAHGMKPFSMFEEEDGLFRRVRQQLPGQRSAFEEAWFSFVSEGEARYPSSSAFVSRIWDGPVAYALCEQDGERSAACRDWLTGLALAGRASCYEVHAGDWRQRFGVDGRLPRPLARLRQDDATERAVTPDAVYVSFDPNMVTYVERAESGRDRADFNMYVDELPSVWDALVPLVNHRMVLQVSSYAVARETDSQRLVEERMTEKRPRGWQGPAVVRLDRTMMSAIFWTDAAAAAGIALDDLPGRFAEWLAAIDRP
jgi:hypothetical protein